MSFFSAIRGATRHTAAFSRQAAPALAVRSNVGGRMALYVGAGTALLGVGMLDGESERSA